MAETGPKTVKIPIFTPSGQNMQLRNKSHKINKHTLCTLATKYEPCKIQFSHSQMFTFQIITISHSHLLQFSYLYMITFQYFIIFTVLQLHIFSIPLFHIFTFSHFHTFTILNSHFSKLYDFKILSISHSHIFPFSQFDICAVEIFKFQLSGMNRKVPRTPCP